MPSRPGRNEIDHFAAASVGASAGPTAPLGGADVAAPTPGRQAGRSRRSCLHGRVDRVGEMARHAPAWRPNESDVPGVAAGEVLGERRGVVEVVGNARKARRQAQHVPLATGNRAGPWPWPIRRRHRFRPRRGRREAPPSEGGDAYTRQRDLGKSRFCAKTRLALNPEARITLVVAWLQLSHVTSSPEHSHDDNLLVEVASARLAHIIDTTHSGSSAAYSGIASSHPPVPHFHPNVQSGRPSSVKMTSITVSGYEPTARASVSVMFLRDSNGRGNGTAFNSRRSRSSQALPER